jgi:DNA topoisomerase-1
MENELDEVEDGAEDWKKVIRDFYPSFAEKLSAALENVAEVEIKDQETDIVCENCGRNLVIKIGKFGKFLACPGFPECRNTKPLFEDAGVPCPKCGAKVFIKKTKKGRRYYACENGEECGFISWYKPTGEKCPVCGEALVEKGRAKKMAVCPKPECGFKKEIEE